MALIDCIAAPSFGIEVLLTNAFAGAVAQFFVRVATRGDGGGAEDEEEEVGRFENHLSSGGRCKRKVQDGCGYGTRGLP